MARAVKNNFKERTIIWCVLYGTLAALMMCLVVVGLFSSFINAGTIKEVYADTAAATAIFLAVLFGGSIAGRLRMKQTAVMSGITSAVVAVILFSVNVIFLDAGFCGLGVKILAVILGWGASSLLTARKKNRR